jgi:hypothetical protein
MLRLPHQQPLPPQRTGREQGGALFSKERNINLFKLNHSFSMTVTQKENATEELTNCTPKG